MITLYHQDSDLKSTNITKQAGLTRKGWEMGIAIADYDHDGLEDIYVTGFGANALYHNLGGCKLEDVPRCRCDTHDDAVCSLLHTGAPRRQG